MKIFSKVNISWNYFIEGHGKNLCDARFSLISRYIKAYITQKNKKIEKTKDIVRAIREMSEKSMRNNFQNSEQIVLVINSFPKEKKTFEIKNISNYHHFHIYFNSRVSVFNTNKISIQSSFLSNDRSFVSHSLNIKTKERNEKMREGFTDPSIDLENLFNENSLSYLENKFQILIDREEKRNEMIALYSNFPTQNNGKYSSTLSLLL
jgi:hypothetical protein